MNRFQYRFSFVCLFLMYLISSTYVKSQPLIQEGILTYKVESIRKTDAGERIKETQKLVIYRKGNLLRIEESSLEKDEILSKMSHTVVRNKEGVFDVMPIPAQFFGDSSMAFGDMVAEISGKPSFTSYKDEEKKIEEAIKNGEIKPYGITKVTSKITWLGLPAERVILSNGIADDTTAAILVRGFNVFKSSPFVKFRNLPGTLLQFSTDAGKLRYTVVSVEPKKLPDSLFVLESAKRSNMNQK